MQNFFMKRLLLLLSCWISITQLNAQQKIFWTSTFFNRVYSGCVEGGNSQVIVDNFTDPYGIEVDENTLDVYFTRTSVMPGIYKTDLDGTTVTRIKPTANLPIALALDTQNGHLYYSVYNTSQILRVNLDGSNETVIHSNIGSAASIELDLSNNQLYWSTISGIKKSNLDGTGVQTVINTTVSHFDLDLVNGHIYWTNRGAQKIERSNLNGTGQQDFLTAIGNVRAIEVDGINSNRLFWSEDLGAIYSANFSNPLPNMVQSLSYNTWDIALVELPPPSTSLLSTTQISQNSARLTFQNISGISKYDYRFKLPAAANWTPLPEGGVTRTVTGLSPSTTYEWQGRVREGNCWSDWTGTITFETAGACTVPTEAQLTTTHIFHNRARLNCVNLSGVNKYDWRFRETGPGNSWIDVPESGRLTNIRNLDSGKTYIWRARVRCGSFWSGYSQPETFTTN